MRRFIISFALTLVAIGISAKDIKTVVLTTDPQMHCESCENKIKGNLRFEKGIKNIKTNIPDQTVTIEYDADKTDVPAIIKGFKKIKYDAKVVEPTTKPDCKEKTTSPTRDAHGSSSHEATDPCNAEH